MPSEGRREVDEVVSTREKETEGWTRASWERAVRREERSVDCVEGFSKGRRRTGNCGRGISERERREEEITAYFPEDIPDPDRRPLTAPLYAALPTRQNVSLSEDQLVGRVLALCPCPDLEGRDIGHACEGLPPKPIRL